MLEVIKVRAGGCVSDIMVCSTGAPQGTVLAPFLFTLYILYLPTDLPVYLSIYVLILQQVAAEIH